MKRIYFLIVTGILTLACGVAVMPTVAPASVNLAAHKNTIAPTPTNHIVESNKMVDTYVTALDKVTVRECPDTDNAKCPPVGYLERGAFVLVMGDARLTPDNIRCGAWLPVAWRGDTGWVCKDWTTNGK